jgi:methylmalonyl-CoA mutase C-terminal domain/subunit
MKEKGMDDVLLFGGGIIPDEDAKVLESMGVGKLFSPGTPIEEIVKYLNDWYEKHRLKRSA